jgi:hypothetical protein
VPRLARLCLSILNAQTHQVSDPIDAVLDQFIEALEFDFGGCRFALEATNGLQANVGETNIEPVMGMSVERNPWAIDCDTHPQAGSP